MKTIFPVTDPYAVARDFLLLLILLLSLTCLVCSIDSIKTRFLEQQERETLFSSILAEQENQKEQIAFLTKELTILKRKR